MFPLVSKSQLPIFLNLTLHLHVTVYSSWNKYLCHSHSWNCQGLNFLNQSYPRFARLVQSTLLFSCSLTDFSQFLFWINGLKRSSTPLKLNTQLKIIKKNMLSQLTFDQTSAKDIYSFFIFKKNLSLFYLLKTAGTFKLA